MLYYYPNGLPHELYIRRESCHLTTFTISISEMLAFWPHYQYCCSTTCCLLCASLVNGRKNCSAPCESVVAALGFKLGLTLCKIRQEVSFFYSVLMFLLHSSPLCLKKICRSHDPSLSHIYPFSTSQFLYPSKSGNSNLYHFPGTSLPSSRFYLPQQTCKCSTPSSPTIYFITPTFIPLPLSM